MITQSLKRDGRRRHNGSHEPHQCRRRNPTTLTYGPKGTNGLPVMCGVLRNGTPNTTQVSSARSPGEAGWIANVEIQRTPKAVRCNDLFGVICSSATHWGRARGSNAKPIGPRVQPDALGSTRNTLFGRAGIDVPVVNGRFQPSCRYLAARRGLSERPLRPFVRHQEQRAGSWPTIRRIFRSRAWRAP